MSFQKPEICTCNHPISAHGGEAMPCAAERCKCKRYDRRNFSDAELEQFRLSELERFRHQVEDRSRAVEALGQPNGEKAKRPPRPRRVLLEQLGRVADALERIAFQLERADALKNPCKAGGHHIWVCQYAPEDTERKVGIGVQCSGCKTWRA